MIVRLKAAHVYPDGSTQTEVLAERQRSAGIRKQRRLRIAPEIRILELDSQASVTETVRQLEATGLYESVEPDRLLHARVLPNDPRLGNGEQWGLVNTGRSGGLAGADIKAASGWDLQRDAPGVIVAVVDSGVRLTHEDLAQNLWVNLRESAANGTDDDANGYTDDVFGINSTAAPGSGGAASNGNPLDDTGHGSHVAGIIAAAGNNGLGMSGVAWRAQVMPLKFLTTSGSGSTADAIECIDYAIAKGAVIINASYGTSTASPAELAVLQRARAAGIIVVVAAGNDSSNNDRTPDYPSSYALDNIVSVAASTRNESLASFSNYGSGMVDLAAPGQDILSLGHTSDSSYVVKNGTSMAAPHVSGALALLRARFPSETPRQLINRLLRGVDRLPAYRTRVQTGGRLNVAKALASTSHRPFNDDFADRAIVNGPSLQIRNAIDDATRESGEPATTDSSTGGGTLWWQWTAGDSGSVTLTTSGSGFDTTLAVFRGDALTSLQRVADHDDVSLVDRSSRVTFEVQAGETYQIAIGAKNATASGLVSARLSLSAANDAFATATEIKGQTVRIEGDNTSASRQAGEVAHAGTSGARSLWYRWTAPASRSVVIAVQASGFDSVLGVYTGSAVDQLRPVVVNNDSLPSAASTSPNANPIVRFEAEAGTTYMIAVSSASASAGGEFMLTLLDAAWVNATGGTVTSSPTVGPDGSVYVGSSDGRLYAYSDTGVLRWTYGTNGVSIDLSTAALGPNQVLYVGDTSGTLHAVSTAGTRQWVFSTGGAITSSPALAADGTLYLRSAAQKLIALQPDGSKRWEYPISGDTYASPAVAPDGTVHVVAEAGQVMALNPDGTLRWTYDAGAEIYASPTLGSDGTVYVATFDGKLHALTPAGKKRWIFEAGGAITSSPAIGPDDTAYFGAYDRRVYAVSASGTLRWTYETGDEIRASSPALGSSGTLYLGSYDRTLHAVSMTDGRRVRTWPTAGIIRSSPVLSAGRLYVGSNDNRIYALEIGDATTSGAWPMHRQNPLRTGRFMVQSPVLITTPVARAVTGGSSVTLEVRANGGGPLEYQWFKDAVPISGATGSSLLLLNLTSNDAGLYTVRVSNPVGSVTSAPARLDVHGAPIEAASSPAIRLVNLSTRARVGSDAVIAGFVLGGNDSRTLLLRGVGPGLTAFGVSGALERPTLTLFDSSGASLANNAGWMRGGQAPAIRSASQSAGAFPLSEASADAALVAPLAAGAYTLQVSSADEKAGIALVEVYAGPAGGPRLVNLSTRALVGTGENVAVAGFVVEGGPKRVLIRGVGPTLANFGLPPANLLADPRLHLVASGGSTISSNEDWGAVSGDAATLAQVMKDCGAFELPAGSKDAALLVTLSPGAYTVQLTGTGASTGVALLEIYEVP